jgi:Amt family ammonium transporter
VIIRDRTTRGYSIFGKLMVAVFGAGAKGAQLGGLAVVALWTVGASRLLVRLCRLVVPLRVDLEIEFNGLDLSVHG